jgi:hypothetical protein
MRTFSDRDGVMWYAEEEYATGAGVLPSPGAPVPRPTKAGVHFWSADGREIWGHAGVGELERLTDRDLVQLLADTERDSKRRSKG